MSRVAAAKVRYEYWQHKVSRELYAVRLEITQVTGVFGPLTAPARSHQLALPHYPYEEDPFRLDWMQERTGEFLLAGDWAGSGNP